MSTSEGEHCIMDEKKELTAVFGERLSRARQRKGMTLNELWKATGGAVSMRALLDYEHGRRLPGSKELLVLCRTLGVRPGYLMREGTADMGHIDFRKKNSLRKREERAVIISAEDAVERYLLAAEISGGRRRFDIGLEEWRVADDEGAIRAAAELRQRWALGKDPIANVGSTLEDHGVIVVVMEAPKEFSGMSAVIDDGTPVVVVNKGMTAERRRLTVIHEMAHRLLSFGEDIDDKEAERLCSVFANETLIPSDVFKAEIGERRLDIAVEELAGLQKKYGISIDALMMKARNNGIISENRYAFYCRKKNWSEDFKRIVEKTTYEEEHSGARLSVMVYKALADGEVSTSKAAELLDVPIEQLLRGLTLA